MKSYRPYLLATMIAAGLGLTASASKRESIDVVLTAFNDALNGQDEKLLSSLLEPTADVRAASGPVALIDVERTLPDAGKQFNERSPAILDVLAVRHLLPNVAIADAKRTRVMPAGGRINSAYTLVLVNHNGWRISAVRILGTAVT